MKTLLLASLLISMSAPLYAIDDIDREITEGKILAAQALMVEKLQDDIDSKLIEIIVLIHETIPAGSELTSEQDELFNRLANAQIKLDQLTDLESDKTLRELQEVSKELDSILKALKK